MLDYLKITDTNDDTWLEASKDKLLKSFSKSDEIYDPI